MNRLTPPGPRVGSDVSARSVLSALSALGCALLGCDPGPLIALTVCGDVEIPSQLDTLRLSVVDEGRVELYAGVVTLFEPAPEGDSTGGDAGDDPGAATCRVGTVKTLPLEAPLTHGAGLVWLRAQGLQDGIQMISVEARAEIPPRGTATATIGLTQACLGVSCPFGQTCISGRCEVTRFGGDPDSCEAPIPEDAPHPGLPLCEEPS